MRVMRFSVRRFLSAVLRPAASQTRLMHSLAMSERVSKSSDFIDVFTPKQPMYCQAEKKGNG